MGAWLLPGSKFKVQSSEFRVQGSEFKVQSSRFRVQSSEFKVQSSEFRVQGSEFRVQGSKFGAAFAPMPERGNTELISRSWAVSLDMGDRIVLRTLSDRINFEL